MTKNIIRWGIIVMSLAIVSLILWNTNVFFQKFKEEERMKMEVLAEAYKHILNTEDLNRDITFENMILGHNHNIPVIMTDDNGKVIQYINLKDEKARDSSYIAKKLARMKAQNQPIVLELNHGVKQYLYYSNSDRLNKLRYYPIGLILVLLLFALVIYFYNTSNKAAAQNQLWTGMAKETAHQIGTPLTSLIGWATLLKENPNTEATALELEKDIARLEVIANRFSKIGSQPELTKQDLIPFTQKTVQYLESRASKQAHFTLTIYQDKIPVLFNAELLGWVLENLIKNALDAMQGKGKISVELLNQPQKVLIKVRDTGKGIPKKLFKRIFHPGFTTKKRGWGLGLSLSKRIVEDFHHGKIEIIQSEPQKGTCIQITLPKK